MSIHWPTILSLTYSGIPKDCSYKCKWTLLRLVNGTRKFKTLGTSATLCKTITTDGVMGKNQWQRPSELKNRRCSKIATTKHHHPVHCTPASYTGGSGFISQSWDKLFWNRFFCFSSLPPCKCWIVPFLLSSKITTDKNIPILRQWKEVPCMMGKMVLPTTTFHSRLRWPLPSSLMRWSHRTYYHDYHPQH